jgi:TonB family protein
MRRPRSTSLRLAAALLLAPASLAGQSQTAQLLQATQRHVTGHQLDSADAALDAALRSATYLMDSVTVFVWRGVLERLRGNDSLARISFRRALALNPSTSVRGLEQVSPGSGELFEAERRAALVYTSASVDERPVRRAGPAVVYPADLRRRRVAGQAVMRVVVDTLGRVEPDAIQIIEVPDSAFGEPLKQMMRATTFTPGRLGGRPVRTQTAISVSLTPPPPGNPTQLVTAARRHLAARRADSALALLDEAIDPAAHASDGERVYALLVQGLAWTAKSRDSLAGAAFDAALAGYRDLTARGVDLAPVLRRLADSVRLARRGTARARPPLAPPNTVDPVDDQPGLVSHPPIRYAPEMQALRIGGTVIVEATLDTTGRVLPATVKIVQSPNPVFDAEARRVVSAAVYRPARTGGRAVRATIRQPVTFVPY